MKIKAIDLFCGAGGTSTGLELACKSRGLDLDLTAVNHWPTAINTHSKNHPKAKHLCERIELVRANDVCKGGLDLLIASPECTHHSNARGGKPINDQSRATAYRVLEWTDVLRPRRVLIENVPEFASWGPIDDSGKRISALKGELFGRYIDMFRALGYTVDFRVLNAADYGDATTRRRMFVVAHRGDTPVTWPGPTHRDPRKSSSALIDDLIPWRPALEAIDLSLPSQSIFTRKKPLVQKTLERIYAGIEQYCGEAAEPFLVILRNHMAGMPIDAPMPTIAASGLHIGLCQPFMVRYTKGLSPSINQPLPTQTTKDRFALVQPQAFILPHRKFELCGADDIGRPLRTIDATNGRQIGVIQPVIIDVNHGNGGEDPAKAARRRTHSVNDPMPTLTTAHGKALVTPHIVETENGVFGIDILFRMLTPRELARAMSFPDSYEFLGTKDEQVRQIGNAVPVGIATVLTGHILDGLTRPQFLRLEVAA